MAIHFLAILRNIEVPPGPPVEVVPGQYLHNDVGAILATFPSEFAPLVGVVDSNAYASAAACVAARWSDADLLDAVRAETLLNSLLAAIQSYLMALWFVRDNCVMCEGGVLVYPKVAGRRIGWHGIKHSLGQYYWNATVQHAATSWRASELLSAREFAERSRLVFASGSSPVSAHPSLPKGVNRLLRGLYYLENARTCSDVGVRIGAYVSCLEALFSTDSSELAHKLSERVAMFLSEDATERVTLYQDVKRAYNIRSKVVHGDEIDAKQYAQLFDVSIRCDDLLRRVFGRVISDEAAQKLFLSSKNEIDTFFLSLTLGGRDLGRAV